MKLDQLYYLTEAIKYQSISIAAKENYVPPSTVSTSISKLEKELETTLLHRSNKGIAPTEAGLRTAEKSRQIFSLLNEIRMDANTDGNRITLNVSAMPSVVDTILADTVLEIEQKGLPLFLNVQTNEPHMIMQNVQLGTSNLGILFSRKSHAYTGLHTQHLFTDRYDLFVGRRSPYYDAESVTMQQALSQPHIAYQSEYEKQTNLLTQLTHPFGLPKIALRVDNTESMRRIIAKSNYVAFFPHFTMYHDAYIESGKIRALRINDADLHFAVNVIESPGFKDMQGNMLIMKVLKQVVSQPLYQETD